MTEYYNEAESEIVSSAKHRQGVIPVEKHLSFTSKCQGGHRSYYKLNVTNSELEQQGSVRLNIIGNKSDIEKEGFAVFKTLLASPCNKNTQDDC